MAASLEHPLLARTNREITQIRDRLRAGHDSKRTRELYAERLHILLENRKRYEAHPSADPFAGIPGPRNDEAF